MDNNVYNVANNAETQVAQVLEVDDTELVVEDGSHFPDPPFVITINDEIIEVNSRNGDSFGDLVRGVEDTSPQVHAVGSTVQNRWTAGTYNRLRDAIGEAGPPIRIEDGIAKILIFDEWIPFARGKAPDHKAIYGVRWDKQADPTLVRTDDAQGFLAFAGEGDEVVQNDFDETWFNFEKVEDVFGNVFVRIPKFYILKDEGEDYFEWAVSQTQYEGYYLPWCFWDFDNGEELPYIDVGAYEASLVDGRLASVPGVMPFVNETIVSFRNYAEANNTGGLRGYQQYDVHAHDMIQTLMFIEFATLDLQSIMMGNVGTGAAIASGFSTSIAASSGSPTSNTSGKDPCVYRGIENPYGNIFKWVDGVNITNHRTWVCKDSAQYASNVFANPYEMLSYTNAASNGYAKYMGFDTNLPFAQFPVVSGGSASTYFCDSYSQNSEERVACVGGRWANGLGAGPSYWALNDSSSDSYSTRGGRLLKKAL